MNFLLVRRWRKWLRMNREREHRSNHNMIRSDLMFPLCSHRVKASNSGPTSCLGYTAKNRDAVPEAFLNPMPSATLACHSDARGFSNCNDLQRASKDNGHRRNQCLFSTRRGGRGGIRTHGELAPTAVFKTAALNHSATLPSFARRLRADHRPVQAFRRWRRSRGYRGGNECARAKSEQTEKEWAG